jgi:hypothetical protein
VLVLAKKCRRVTKPRPREQLSGAVVIVQETRHTLNAAKFSFTAEDLRLPLQLFNLRKEHAGDAAVNARLDQVLTQSLQVM